VIGSAVVATTEITLSDHSAIDANNHVFSLIPKPLLIPNGFLVSVIGSAPVSYFLNPSSLLFRGYLICILKCLFFLFIDMFFELGGFVFHTFWRFYRGGEKRNFCMFLLSVKLV
jgi:hypothetical protein